MTIKKTELPTTMFDDFVKFAESDWDCAEVYIGDKRPETIYNSYKQILRRHKDKFPNIRVMMRKKRLFLVKEEG